MKITHKQLSQIIKEELSSIRESLPYDKATVFDVWKKGPWVSAHGGQSRGPEDGEPMGRVRVSSPQYASELMHTLGQHGFDAGKIKPIYDNDGDNVVDWDEFIQLISDLSGQAEEAPGVADSPAGLGGETYEKTAADYKKHPEWFNEGKIKITRRQLRRIIKEEVSNLLSEAQISKPAAIEGLCPAIYTPDGSQPVEKIELEQRDAFATHSETGQYTTTHNGHELPAWKGYDQRPYIVGTVVEIDLGWPAAPNKVEVVHKGAHPNDPQPDPVMTGCGEQGRIILADYSIIDRK